MDGRAPDRFAVDRESIQYLNSLGLQVPPARTLLYNPASGQDSASQLSDGSPLSHQGTSSVGSLNQLHRRYLSQSVSMPQHAYGYNQLNSAYLSQYNLPGTSTSGSGPVNISSECFKALYPAFPYWSTPTAHGSFPEGYSSHIYGLTQPPAIYPSYLPLSCDATRAGLGNKDMMHPLYSPPMGSIHSRPDTSRPPSDSQTVTQTSGVILSNSPCVTQPASLLSPESQTARHGGSHETATVAVDKSADVPFGQRPASSHQSAAGRSSMTTITATTTTTGDQFGNQSENEKCKIDDDHGDVDDDNVKDDEQDSDEISVDDQTNSVEQSLGKTTDCSDLGIKSPTPNTKAERSSRHSTESLAACGSSVKSPTKHQSVKHSQSPASKTNHGEQKERRHYVNWHLKHSNQDEVSGGSNDGDIGLAKHLKDSDLGASSRSRDEDSVYAAGTALVSDEAVHSYKQIHKKGYRENRDSAPEGRDIQVTGSETEDAKLLKVKLEKEPSPIGDERIATEWKQSSLGRNTHWMYGSTNNNCDVSTEDCIKVEHTDSPSRKQTYHDNRKKVDLARQKSNTASDIHSPGISVKSELRSTRKDSKNAVVTVSVDSFAGNIQYSVCRLSDNVQSGVNKVSATTFTPEIGTLPSVTSVAETGPSFRLADNNNNSNSSYCSDSTLHSTGLCCNEIQVSSDVHNPVPSSGLANLSVTVQASQKDPSPIITSKMDKWSPSDCSQNESKSHNRNLGLMPEQFVATVSPKKEVCVKSEDQQIMTTECHTSYHAHQNGHDLLSPRSNYPDKHVNPRHPTGEPNGLANHRVDPGRAASPQFGHKQVSPDVERSTSSIDIKREHDPMSQISGERPSVPNAPCSWQPSAPVDRYDTLIHSIAPFYAHFMSPHYPVDPRLLPLYPDKQDASWLQSSGYLLPASLPRMQLPPVFAPSQALPVVTPELVRCPQDGGTRPKPGESFAQQGRLHNPNESEKLTRCVPVGHGIPTQLDCASSGNDQKDVKVDITDGGIKSESPSVCSPNHHDNHVHTVTHKMTRKVKTKSERDDGILTNCIHGNIPGKQQNIAKIKSQSMESLFTGKTCQMMDSSGPKVIPKVNDRSGDRDQGHDILLNCPASTSATIPVGIAYAHQRSTSQTESKEAAVDPENQRPTNCSNHDSDVRQVQQVKPTTVNEVQNFIDVVPIVSDVELDNYNQSPWLHREWSRKPIPVPSGYRLVQDKKSAQMFLLPEGNLAEPQQDEKCLEISGNPDNNKTVAEKYSLQKTEEVTISTVTTETITKSVAVKHNNYNIVTQTSVLSSQDDQVKNSVTDDECDKSRCDVLTSSSQSQVSQPPMTSVTGRTVKQAVVVKPQTTTSQSARPADNTADCLSSNSPVTLRKRPLFGVHRAGLDHYGSTESCQEKNEVLSCGERHERINGVSQLALVESRGTSPIGFSDDVPLKYLIYRKLQTVSTLTDQPEQISSAIQTDISESTMHTPLSVMVKETCVQTLPSVGMDLVSDIPLQDDTTASVFSRTTSNLLKAASSISSCQADGRYDGDVGCEGHRNTPPVLTKIVDADPLCSNPANPNVSVNAVPSPVYYNGTVGISQPTDGLHLLSILAEHLQRNNTSEERQTISPDINKNYNAPKSFCFDDKDFVQNKTYFLKKTDADDDAVFQPQWTSNIFKINIEPDNMDAMELDYRVRLAEIQRKYKEKQKQLAKLHHKKSDEQHSSKRKPGRPKRRGSQKSSVSSRSDDVISSSDNVSSDQSTKKKCHNKHTNELAIRREQQKTALKTNSNKQGTKTKTKPVTVGQSKPDDKISDEPESYQSTSGLGLLAEYAICQAETVNTENISLTDKGSITKRKKKLLDASSQDEDEDVPAKKRKPGRPKKFDEESVTETIVAKKPKNLSFFSYGNSKGYGSAFRRTHSKTVFGNKTACFMSKMTMLGGKSCSLANKFTALGSKSLNTGIKSSTSSKSSVVASKPSQLTNKSGFILSKISSFSNKPDVSESKSSAHFGKADIHMSKSFGVANKYENHEIKGTSLLYKSDIHRSKISPMHSISKLQDSKPSTISNQSEVSGCKSFAVAHKYHITASKPAIYDSYGSMSSAISGKCDSHGNKSSALSGKADNHSSKSLVSNKPDITGIKCSVSGKPDVTGMKSSSALVKSDFAGIKSATASCRPDIHTNKSAATSCRPDIHTNKSAATSCRPDIHTSKSGTTSCKSDIHMSKSTATLCKSDIHVSKSTTISYRPDIHVNKFAGTSSRPNVHSSKSAAASSCKSDTHGSKSFTTLFKSDAHRSRSSAVSSNSDKSDISEDKPSAVSSKCDILGSRLSLVSSKSEVHGGKLFGTTSKSDILGSITSLIFNKTDSLVGKSSLSSIKSDATVCKFSPSSKLDVTGCNPSPVVNTSDVADCKSEVDKTGSVSSQTPVVTSITCVQASRSSTSKPSTVISKPTSVTSDTAITNSIKEETSATICSTISYRRRSERIFISESLQTAKASTTTTVSSATSFGTSTTSSDDVRDDVSNQSSKTSNKQSNRTDHASADREHNGNQSATSQCTKANNSQKDGQSVQKDQPSNTPGKTKANKDSAKSVQVQDVSHKLKKKSTGTKMGSPDTDTKNEASEGQVEVNKTKNESKEKSVISTSVRSPDGGSDSDDTSSDGDSLPLSKLIHHSPAPEVISCKLTRKDIKDNLSVLFFKEGLFYEATVVNIQPPDIYGVLIEGERGSRPHILPTEELLEKAVLDVKCISLNSLPSGTRVCAYWSQQFSCLYPGCISKDTTTSNSQIDPSLICVEFDDGDSGKIPLEHIRLLPADFPLQDLETNPLMMISNRKRRSTGEDLMEVKKHKLSSSDGTGSHILAGQSKTDNKSVSKSVKSRVCEAEKKRADASPGARNGSKNVSKLKVSSKVASSVKTRMESSLKGRSQSSGRSKERSSGVPSHRLSSHMMSSASGKSSRMARSHMVCHDQTDSSNDDSAATSSQSGDSSSSTESGDDDEYIPVKNKSQTRTSYRDEKSQSKVISPRKRQQQSDDQMVPLQQLWQWVGKGTKRPGMKGKAKREYFKSIQRGSEIINVGDCAVFLSAGRTLPYVGRIVSLWQGWGGNMVVKVKWFYHPEETKGGKKLAEIRGALYQSPHVDENDVQTISHKCELLSYVEWKAYRAHKQQECQRKGITCDFDDDVYYLAGTYDPTIGMITFQPDVKLL